MSESLTAELVHLANVDSGCKPFPWSERELKIISKMPVQSRRTEISIQIHCQPNVLSLNSQKNENQKVLLYCESYIRNSDSNKYDLLYQTKRLVSFTGGYKGKIS